MERKELLKEKSLSFDKYSRTIEVNSINDPVCVELISKQKPDVIIVFGTGIVKKCYY